MTPQEQIDAGDFGTWYTNIRRTLATGCGIDVPCGDCRGCCSAGRFIHLTPADRQAHAVIPRDYIIPAPGMAAGNAVLGYRDDGCCPLLNAGNCSIYSSRPATCRIFDCRVLAAAGLRMYGRWAERINQRIGRWAFAFATGEDQRRFDAVRQAATFIRTNASAFPGGRVPTSPGDLAVLAIKVAEVFLSSPAMDSRHLVQAIIAESRAFERTAMGDAV